MRTHARSRWSWILPTALVLPAIAACFIYRGVQSKDALAMHPAAPTTTIKSPVKAHLLDGSIVMFRGGAEITPTSISGNGQRFNAALTDSSMMTSVHLDSVIALESFEGHTRWGPTIIVSSLVTVGTSIIIGAVAGGGKHNTPAPYEPPCNQCTPSCPLVYSDSAGHPALEAELISLSISKLLEGRDVHALRAQPDAQGLLSLEVRDESFETHYLNQLALLEVQHDPDESVVPDGAGNVLAVRTPLVVASMRDRTGRDVRAMLAAGTIFRSDSALLANASSHDLDDHVDIVVPAPRGGFPADSVAIMLDLKSSPLSTLLYIEQMLAAQGARSVDWQAADLSTIGYVVELGRWYGSRMGMRITVPSEAGYQEVAYVPDDGPMAYRKVVAVVPAPRTDSLRVRLSFVADHWRIRGIDVRARVRYPEVRTLAPALVIGADGVPDSAALRSLAETDTRYVAATPGQHMTVRFDVGRGHGSPRTFLLAAQGYYTEWIPVAWLRSAPTQTSYVPGDTSLVLEMHRWAAMRGSLESEPLISYYQAR